MGCSQWKAALATRRSSSPYLQRFVGLFEIAVYIHVQNNAGFNIRIAWWIVREPSKSQEVGKEDQGKVTQLGLAVLRRPGPPGLPSGLLDVFAPKVL